RHGHTATLLPDGRVLITGGASNTPGTLASAELYDSATGTFTATGSMTTPRFFHTATLLADGRVLIAGDFRRVSAELYDPSPGPFPAPGHMREPGADTATLLPNGTVLITHSDLVGCRADHAELYNPRSGTFTRTGDMTASHTGPTATLLTTGKVLLA